MEKNGILAIHYIQKAMKQIENDGEFDTEYQELDVIAVKLRLKLILANQEQIFPDAIIGHGSVCSTPDSPTPVSNGG